MSRVEIQGQSWGTLNRNVSGNLQAHSGATATIKNLNGSAATHWSAVIGGTSSTASLTSDSNGNLGLSGATRFIEAGQYTIDVPSLGVTGLRVEAAPGTAMQSEPYTVPYTLYVNQADGSDSNTGNSPGVAFQTLSKAINQLQQIGLHGGYIRVVTAGAANLTVASPVAIVRPIWIVVDTPGGVAIERTYGTPNGRSVWDAVTTAAGTQAASATIAATGADVNRIVSIYGAGVGGGTFYDFITSVPDATHVNFTAPTAVARNATTDHLGVKMSIVGDYTQQVTDAAMTTGTSVVTSATAAWSIGQEVIIAGAGQGGQALRGAVKTVSGTSATLTATASNTVSNKRCAVGVNFGDLFCFHTASSGLRNVTLTDNTANTAIGAAVKLIQDDLAGGSTNVNDLALEHVRFTSTGTQGAWEHMIDGDGSWGQGAGGGGIRRVSFLDCKFFGARTPGETVRLVNAVHWNFTGGGGVGSAPTSPSVQQGVVILDPHNNGGGLGRTDAQDINFVGTEGDFWSYYSEGWNCTYIGDRLEMGVASTGRRTVELSPTSKSCYVCAPNHTVVGGAITAAMADEYDAGTNNQIVTQNARKGLTRTYEQALSGPTISGVTSQQGFETISRRAFRNESVTAGSSSGVLALASLWLPGGASFSKVSLNGNTALAWGTGFTGPHFIYGIYDPDGNLIAQSNDTGGTQTFTNSFAGNVLAITKDGAGTTITSARAPRSGLHWIALLVNSGTGGTGFTYPTFGGMLNSLAAINPALVGSSGTALTALPTTVTVPPTGTGTGIPYGAVA